MLRAGYIGTLKVRAKRPDRGEVLFAYGPTLHAQIAQLGRSLQISFEACKSTFRPAVLLEGTIQPSVLDAKLQIAFVN